MTFAERIRQLASQSSLTDWIIAFFTFVLAGSAIYQFLIMNGQLDDMRKDQRPWIQVSFKIDTPKVNAPVAGTLEIVNKGKTPARDMKAIIAVEAVKNGVEPRLDYAKPDSVVTAGALFPDATVSMPFSRVRPPNGNNDVYTQSEIDDLKTSRIFFVVYTNVSYKDFFGVEHWTRSCMWWMFFGTPGSASAQKCSTYADVDSN